MELALQGSDEKWFEDFKSDIAYQNQVDRLNVGKKILLYMLVRITDH